MNKNQTVNQEQKKHFLTSHKSQKTLRFTAALCAAAVLVGGVAYAATPETAEAASDQQPMTATEGSTFTEVVLTTYSENDFLPDDMIKIDAMVDKTDVSLAVISNRIYASLEKQNKIPSGWPVESRIVSTEFNPTADPSISDGRKHEGMDISTRSQIIPIYATADGVVVTANYDSGYGNQVIIDHGNGFTTLYAHCNELTVSAGETVEKGDMIATTGNSGWSTGIHLHYEVMLNGVYQNPRNFL